ncbi:MAG: G5 domain-containing protein [Clostridia bacterium]|nr:G5 domain-containing protein [Clostridia bacterium]
MIKRGNASDGESANFSPEKDANTVEVNKADTVSERRVISDASVSARPDKAKMRTGQIPRVQTGQIPKVQTGSIPRVPTGQIPRVQTGQIPRVQTGQIPRVQTGQIPKVQTGQIPRVQTGQIPRVQTGQIPKVATGQIPKVKETKKEKSKKRRAAKIVSTVIVILMIAGVSVYAALMLINANKEEAPVFIPPDTVAGTNESSDVMSSPHKETTYLSASRYNVKFTFYESPDIVCNTAEVEAGELMDILGIDHGESKRVSVDLSSVISEDTLIDVKSISKSTDTKTEPIPFETEYVDDDTIYEGEEEVAIYGYEGVKTFTYECTLVNGEEESRELVSEEVTIEPQNTIIYRGTKVYVPPVPAWIPETVYSGIPDSYLYYVDVQATCYSIVGTTATGLPTGNNVMAVDPNVIPLGSQCIVIGALGDYGYRIAADVGGGIKGNIIDIWVPEGTGFGWQNARVYVIG